MPGKTPVMGARRMSVLASSNISSRTARPAGSAAMAPPESTGLSLRKNQGMYSPRASIVRSSRRGTESPAAAQRSTMCDAVPPDMA